MVYGSEAILPTDRPRLRSAKGQGLQQAGNEASLEDAMDLLDEACDIALLHSAKYQQALQLYHSQRVRGCTFGIGDLVLCRI